MQTFTCSRAAGRSCRQCEAVRPEVFARHLTGTAAAGGDFHVGIYPMLPDDNCRLLVCDFDTTATRELVVRETELTTEEWGNDGPSIQAIHGEIAGDAARNQMSPTTNLPGSTTARKVP
ncbi:MAG: TOTE conflict system archaeo-eukaryotic primase domain-containing protein [Lacisediminihabitans sp.]